MSLAEAFDAPKRWVVLDRPGVLRAGAYERDTPYLVDAAEAARLVEHKGFRFTTDPSAPAAGMTED